MSSSLKERFARLAPVRGVDRVTSGSPVAFVLRLDPSREPLRTIDAMVVLARRGVTMLKAKRHIEALLETGTTVVELPTVESTEAVRDELARAGIDAVSFLEPQPLDVRGLRERLGLTREQFGLRYGIEVETLRNWETGKREPDTTARSYLRAISNAPEQVGRAYTAAP